MNGTASSDVVLDRDDLPERFRRLALTSEEIEAIDVLYSIGTDC